MHCVLLGVVKTTTEMWLSDVGADYYIGSPKNLATIDSRLLNIKTPSEIARRPRTMKERKLWKANEWRNWLLFYVLACTVNVLPKKYLTHFLLLSQGIFILLKSTILPTELDRASYLIHKFVYKYQLLYNEWSMLSNVHFLLHLPKSVLNFGPLWAHSCFAFETANGYLISLVNGTQGIPIQVSERYLRHLTFESILQLSHLRNNIETMIQKFCFTLRKYSKDYYLALGKPVLRKLSKLEVRSLEKQNANQDFKERELHQIFKRCIIKGTLFHGTEYQRSTKQCNCFAFLKNNGKSYYGEILYFIALNNATVEGYENKWVILREYRIKNSTINPYMMEAVKTKYIYAFLVLNIQEKVFLIKGHGKDYIFHFPNSVESTGIM